MHEHVFTKRRPDSTVLTCACGRFRHADPVNAIVEQPANQTEATMTKAELTAMIADIHRDALALIWENPAEYQRLADAEYRLSIKLRSMRANETIDE